MEIKKKFGVFELREISITCNWELMEHSSNVFIRLNDQLFDSEELAQLWIKSNFDDFEANEIIIQPIFTRK